MKHGDKKEGAGLQAEFMSPSFYQYNSPVGWSYWKTNNEKEKWKALF